MMKRHSNHEKQSRYTKEKKFVAVLAAAGALGAAALSGCSTTGDKIYAADDSGRVVATYDVDDVLDGKITPDSSSEKPVGSELTKEQRFNLSISDYYNVDEALRAADQARDFEIGVRNSYQHIVEFAMKPGLLSEKESTAINDGTFYLPDLDKDRSEWSDQDFMNYHTLAIFLLTSQSIDYQDDALKALSVLTRTNTSAFDNIEKHILEHPGEPLLALYRAVPTPLSNSVVTPTEAKTVSGNWQVGHLVGHRSLHDGKIAYSFFIDMNDASGNTVSIKTDTYGSLTSPELKEMIRNHAS